MILPVTVSADANPSQSISAGNATKDRVYLLSITEVNHHFSGDSARRCKPTAYAKAQGSYVADNGKCFWWLRSPGRSQRYAAGVGVSGAIYEDGNYVHSNRDTIRPVIHLQFS